MDWNKIMPDAFRVFFRQRSPRPIQTAAMPVLVRGQSVLLSSPTASGKTEAVFAPLYQRHTTFRRSDLSVVYVAPTKALVNDMYERLSMYFGSTSVETIQRYTGDHHDFKDPTGKFALLATPEALDSLQLVQPGLLRGVRAVICDELHLLHGHARGQQLRSVIARTRCRAESPRDSRDTFQVTGMTATVRDQESVAQLWLGPDSQVIKTGEPRPIEMSIISSPKSQIASVIADRLRGSPYRKILVFANSRNGAHQVAAALSTELSDDRWPVYLHIGILSRAERERIEGAMRRDPKAVCVATSTLEVGIDIGDIDLVILCDPPGSISGFLQRIGRGNRRSDQSVVWACSANPDEEARFRALLHCGVNGILDDEHEYDRPSVQFQQALSLAWIGARLNDPLTMLNYAERSGDAVTETAIRDMVEGGVLRDVRGALVPSDVWMDEGDQRRIHSVIVGGSGLPLVDLQSGEIIGSADRATGIEGAIYAGSQLKAIHASDRAGVYLGGSVRGPARPLAKLPSARGRMRGISRQLAWAMAELASQDPRVWVTDGQRVTTWGGAQYNRFLAALLSMSGEHGIVKSDAKGVSVTSTVRPIVPGYARRLALEAFAGNRIPLKVAASFREPTPYFSHLSRSLQNQEVQAALPRGGFLQWIDECLD